MNLDKLEKIAWLLFVMLFVLIWKAGGLVKTTPPSDEVVKPAVSHHSGIHPNLKTGDMPPEDAADVSRWIDDAVSLMQSPEFEANFRRASALYPKLFVSRKEDMVASETVLARLKTQDPRLPALWWPEAFVVLIGEPAARSSDLKGFGFEASRKAGAGPLSGNPAAGEIELGRLHFARYTRGDVVEKSCALNTMVHEISHTLSEKPGEFWMHILDSEDRVTAPSGVFEASYFIGTVAQCTYLQSAGHILAKGFEDCLMTFSDPRSGSRFKSLACDDFPGSKPITPQGRLSP